MKTLPLLITLILSSTAFAANGIERGTLVYKKDFLEVKAAHEKIMSNLETKIATNSSSVADNLNHLLGHDRWLNEHSQTLNVHLETLKGHTNTLSSHTDTLKSHGDTLNKHAGLLDQHTRLIDQQGQLIHKAQNDIRDHDGRISNTESAVKNHDSQLEVINRKSVQIQETQKGVAEVLAAENNMLKNSIAAIQEALAQANIPVQKEPEEQARERVTTVLNALLADLSLDSTNIVPEELSIIDIEGLNAFLTVCLSNPTIKQNLKSLKVENDPATSIYTLNDQEGGLSLSINIAFPGRRLIPASVQCANSR